MASEALFQTVYEQWLAAHVRTRTGERRRRLEEGHGHAERKFVELIWYPFFGGFDHHHPEYELVDFGGNQAKKPSRPRPPGRPAKVLSSLTGTETR